LLRTVINIGISFLVVVSTLVMASFLAFTDNIPQLFGWQRSFLIGFLLVYAVLRIWRIKQFWMNLKND